MLWPGVGRLPGQCQRYRADIVARFVCLAGLQSLTGRALCDTVMSGQRDRHLIVLTTSARGQTSESILYFQFEIIIDALFAPSALFEYLMLRAYDHYEYLPFQCGDSLYTSESDVYSVQSPCSVTVLSHRVQSPCSVTVFRHRVKSPCSVTVFSHRVQSPCSVTVLSHRVQSPCSVTVFSHRVQSPCSVTVFSHRVQSPCSVTVFSHRVQSPC